MRLHRFYVGSVVGNNTSFYLKDAELSSQLRRVFRFKRGDTVILFDNSGMEYTANIEDLRDDSVSFDIVECKDRFNSKKELYLFASLVKKDTFEWIVEKATELGVSDIFPVVSERSEKKNLNVDRLLKISKEASEQSGRVFVPNISKIISLDEAIKTVKDKSMKPVVFHTKGVRFKYSVDNQENFNAIFIGPEGGFTEKEIDTFSSNNIPIYNLGENILRSETATVVAISKFI